MNRREAIVIQASAVAIAGRGLLIEGQPGAGKSSLALALIDRGATLIGDDAVTLERRGDQIIASPPPNIAGKLEIHGIGIIEFATAAATPLSLILNLDAVGERLPGSIPVREILGVEIPFLAFDPGAIAPAVRAEHALQRHGIDAGQGGNPL